MRGRSNGCGASGWDLPVMGGDLVGVDLYIMGGDLVDVDLMCVDLIDVDN